MIPVNAHEELQHTLELVKSDAKQKSITLETHFRAKKSVIQADPSRLQQIFWNIIKNSIKFSPQNSNIVVITENYGILNSFVVKVIDKGVGIEPHQLPKIFNTFQQGGPNMVHQFGGTNNIE